MQEEEGAEGNSHRQKFAPGQNEAKVWLWALEAAGNVINQAPWVSASLHLGHDSFPLSPEQVPLLSCLFSFSLSPLSLRLPRPSSYPLTGNVCSKKSGSSSLAGM